MRRNTRNGGRMKISELAARADVTRETIHYYLKEGLLPPPYKTSRNMSYYDDTHLARLRLIKRLQSEKFLPLSVIRRMILNESAVVRDATFALIAEAGESAQDTGYTPVNIPEAAATLGIPLPELERLNETGVLLPGKDGTLSLHGYRICQIYRELARQNRNPAHATRIFAVPARYLRLIVEEEARDFFARVVEGDTSAANDAQFREAKSLVNEFMGAFRSQIILCLVETALEEISVTLSTQTATYYPLSQPARDACCVEAALAQLAAAARASQRPEPWRVWLRTLVAVGGGKKPAAAPPSVVRRHTDLLGLWAAHLRDHACHEEASQLSAQLQRDGASNVPALIVLARTRAYEVRHATWTSYPAIVGGMAQVLRLLNAAVAAAAQDHEVMQAYARLFRGRFLCALPRVLGTGATGMEDLRAVAHESMARLDKTSEPGVEKAVALRLGVNAHFFMGEYLARMGQREAAAACFREVFRHDVNGPAAMAAVQLGFTLDS